MAKSVKPVKLNDDAGNWDRASDAKASKADVLRLAKRLDEAEDRLAALHDMVVFLARHPGWTVDDYLKGATRGI